MIGYLEKQLCGFYYHHPSTKQQEPTVNPSKNLPDYLVSSSGHFDKTSREVLRKRHCLRFGISMRKFFWTYLCDRSALLSMWIFAPIFLVSHISKKHKVFELQNEKLKMPVRCIWTLSLGNRLQAKTLPKYL